MYIIENAYVYIIFCLQGIYALHSLHQEILMSSSNRVSTHTRHDCHHLTCLTNLFHFFLSSHIVSVSTLQSARPTVCFFSKSARLWASNWWFRFLSSLFVSNFAWCTCWSMWDFLLHSAVVLSTDVFLSLCARARLRELLVPDRDHPCPSLQIRLPLQDLLLEPAVLVVFFFLLWCARACLRELLVPRRDHPCPR